MGMSPFILNLFLHLYELNLNIIPYLLKTCIVLIYKVLFLHLNIFDRFKFITLNNLITKLNSSIYIILLPLFLSVSKIDKITFF